MKRSDISNLTPEQCADELTLMKVKKLLQKARKAQQKADTSLSEVFQALDDMCIDLDVPSDAENAETLEEAVNCYAHYGEFGLKGLMKEIREQYTKQTDC